MSDLLMDVAAASCRLPSTRNAHTVHVEREFLFLQRGVGSGRGLAILPSEGELLVDAVFSTVHLEAARL